MKANRNRRRSKATLFDRFHGAGRLWAPARLAKTARIFVTAAAAAAVLVAAPITIGSTAGGSGVTFKPAEAGNGGGGNNGGGNQRGGNNGGGNNGGGNGGGNNGGGNGGGGNGGGGNNGGGNNGGGGNQGDGGQNGGNRVGNGNPSAGDRTRERDNDRKIIIILEPRVALAVLTTGIRKRNPTNQVEFVADPNQAVSFYTAVEGMSGRTVSHRWIFNGVLRHEVSFEIRANKWRVWSTQLLPRGMAGTWNVQIVGEDGVVLQARSLDYRPTG